MIARSVIRILFVLAVAGAIGLSVHAVLWGVDARERTRYWHLVRRLQALDTLLNEAVLRSRSGLLLSYDPIVFAVREGLKAHEALKVVPAFLPRDGGEQLLELVEVSRKESLAKAELVEQFKSENAVLRTSLHYFPILITAVADRAASFALPLVGASAQAVAGSIMLFETTGDDDARGRVRRALTALDQVAAVSEFAPLQDELVLIGKHANIILERKPVVDQLVRGVLAQRTLNSQRITEERFADLDARALEAAVQRRQWILGLLLGAVIFGMMEVIGSMRISGRARERLTLELGAAHAKLAQEHERERELGAARSRFLAMTSHEIRTPLTAITSSTEMLLSFGAKWGSERIQDHLRRIRDAAESMERMVEEVLLIGRADAGSLGSAPSLIALNVFCQELLEALEQKSGRTQPIEYKFEGDVSVSLDERLLRHILGNLLSNAMKYSPLDAPITFSVTAFPSRCEFVVADRGLGIPSEYLPHLYKSYHRAKNVEHLPGSGLGLAVVERAVLAQGGTIECKSRQGEGTTFTVRIPRQSGRRRGS